MYNAPTLCRYYCIRKDFDYMNLQDFKKQYLRKKKNKDAHMSYEEYIAAHHKDIDAQKAENIDNLYIVPIEEMAELTQHLSKIIRNKESADRSNFGAIEEIADVQICIDQLKILFGITEDDLKYAIDVKMERNLKRLSKKG